MFPVRAFVPVRAWIWSWAPEVQLAPATGVPENVSGVELRLGAVPQMVPPVTVKPPAPSSMLSAAVLSSVSTPPLVKELLPSKTSAPEVPTVRMPSLVTVGTVPLAPIVMVPSSVTLPADEMSRPGPVPSTVMFVNEVPDSPRTRDPSTVVGPLTVRLRPLVRRPVPMVSVAPWRDVEAVLTG